jgi:threonine synthase
VIVSDDEILSAIPRLASLTGVFAEPAAAAALTGLERALTEGLIDRAERVVLMVTGSGLKDIAAAGRVIETPEAIAPTMDAVMTALSIRS